MYEAVNKRGGILGQTIGAVRFCYFLFFSFSFSILPSLQS